MSNSDWITVWGIAISLLVTTIGSALVLAFYMGRNFGSIRQEIKAMAKALEDLPKIKYTLGQMQVKLDVLWKQYTSKSNSPLSLSEAGLKLLETSGIGEFANHYYAEVFSKVRALGPENAYQAQEGLISIMSEYQHNEECIPKLEDTAFFSGSDIDTLLFVAALSIRDKIISDLGF